MVTNNRFSFLLLLLVLNAVEGFAQPSSCESPTMDGYTYDVVQIGDQCWLAENLRTTVYRNGDSIPNVTVEEEWGALNSGEVGASCAYDNEASNTEDFGLLYNGYAVSDDRALCPSGWHLPIDQEWMVMELELGLSSSELAENGWRGSDANVGHSLKSAEVDSPAWNGENSAGFNAEPGGFRFGFSPGGFSDLGALGNWWTASLRSDGNGIIRRLSGAEDGIRRDGYGRLSGLSVRCILGDSSAVILGCTDPNFLEYDPLATVDDGSCATPVIEDCIFPTMDGMLSWYPFNAGDATNQVADSLHGEVMGSPTLTTDRFGNPDAAWHFDAVEDFISVPGSQGVNPFPFSISLWFQPDEDFLSLSNTPLFKKYAPAAWNGIQVGYRRTPDGEHRVTPWYLRSYNQRLIGDFGGEEPFNWVEDADDGGMWHHAVFTADSAGGHLYIDGELVSTDTWTGDPAQSTSNFLWQIGGGYDGNDSLGYNGAIDDLGIWGRTLTAGEAYDLYACDGYATECGCGGLTSMEYQGREYGLVELAGKCWFSDNLATETFSNGDSIPYVNSGDGWPSYSQPRRGTYGDDPALVDQTGYMYNWLAAGDPRGLCPTGWKVPAQADFEAVVEAYGTENALYRTVEDWDIATVGEGNNGTGFSGRGFGERNYLGVDVDWGIVSHFWSSTEPLPQSGNRWVLGLSPGYPFQGFSNLKGRGSYIRCMADGAIACDTIPGCTDPNFLEYNPLATVDDGSCATPVIQDCESPTMDGYTYDVVQIGDQCWFAENLRTSIYRNGNPIPAGLNAQEWSALTGPASAVYGEGDAGCTEDAPGFDACMDSLALAEYGRLYNGYAVFGDEELCPVGWHVPNDLEWKILEMHVGMAPTELNALNVYRGGDQNVGSSLKATQGWFNDGNGTDDYGFGGRPAGSRGNEGTYYNAGKFAPYWTSTPNLTRDLSWSQSGIYRDPNGLNNGYAVRCILGDCPAMSLGCTDPDACNYDALASDDDGSCSQLQVTEVVGLTEVAAGTVTTYAAEEAAIGNSYEWTVTGGEIAAGQGTPYVVVAWNEAGDHSISVVESNADCGEVTITVAVSVTEVMGVGETMVSAGLAVTVAPNPFRSDFTLLMTLPRHARVAASLWDMNGKRIQNSMMEPLPVGEHALHISTANLPAGIYAVRVRFEGEGWTESKVLRIVKE